VVTSHGFDRANRVVAFPLQDLDKLFESDP